MLPTVYCRDAWPSRHACQSHSSDRTGGAKRCVPTARAEHRSPERSQDFMTDGPLERLPGKTSDKNDT
ncbi:hypothetical protein IPC436_04340 [Pseudomonas aeruginosa]|nr:hypothetical protein IPC436_04340 [Pseudomonas aeruginosa]